MSVPQTSSLWAGSFKVPSRTPSPPAWPQGQGSILQGSRQLAVPAKVPSSTEACEDLAARQTPPWSLHDDITVLPTTPGAHEQLLPGSVRNMRGTLILTCEKQL